MRRNLSAKELELKQLVGEVLRQALKQSNLTAVQLSDKLGAATPMIYECLKGNYKRVSLTKMLIFLTKLGFDIEIWILPSDKEQGKITVQHT